MDFLILFKTGEELADYRVVNVILNKKKGQAEDAIREATTEGPGEYLAVQFDNASVTRKLAKLGIELGEPEVQPEPETPTE